MCCPSPACRHCCLQRPEWSLPAGQRTRLRLGGFPTRRAKARERLPSCSESPSFHPKTTCWRDGLDPFNTSVPFRLLPLRAPTSGKLRSSSRLAPSLSHRPTLRSTGEEDARCVEPTSATHTNYVHPHLACSRLTPLVTQRGRPPETKAPDDTIGGPSVSRHSRPLRRTVTAC